MAGRETAYPGVTPYREVTPLSTINVTVDIHSTQNLKDALAANFISTDDFSQMFNAMSKVWQAQVSALPLDTLLLRIKAFHVLTDACVAEVCATGAERSSWYSRLL